MVSLSSVPPLSRVTKISSSFLPDAQMMTSSEGRSSSFRTVGRSIRSASTCFKGPVAPLGLVAAILLVKKLVSAVQSLSSSSVS